MTEPAVVVTGLTKRFGDHRAVDGVSFTLEPGQLLALVGPSGCGKTTTLRLVAGLEQPDEGEIQLAGRTVAGPDRSLPPEARGVGLVFQSYALFPHLSVAENVAFGLKGKRSGASGGPSSQERVAALLHQMHLGARADARIDELSGGEQQRVALARALAPGPAAVLLDEPFANLDPGLRSQVRDEVESVLRQAGATAILVTHDQEEALALADRVGIMSGGRLLQLGAPDEVYRRPASLEVARLLGGGNVLPARVEGAAARSALGEVSLDEPPAAGPARLFVRPEQLTLVDEGGVVGRVRRRRYLGPHTELLVELAPEMDDFAFEEVTVRRPGFCAVTIDDEVRVTVAGAARAYPLPAS